jgi:glycosyltransferase involved in cell wall biosynthesis
VSDQLGQIQEARFAIVANGFTEGGPAQALRDFLVSKRARQVITVFHPLSSTDPSRHEMTVWERGAVVRNRAWKLPSRPPLTFPLDLVAPISMPEVDCWFGFNALACWRGILARRRRKARKAVYWCVDFVRSRFGGGALTRLYEFLDGYCCEMADYRFDISQPAADARSARHRGRDLAPTTVVPIGAWLDRAVSTPEDGYRSRKVIYLGNLVPTQGGPLLLEALVILARRNYAFSAEIVGRGPLLTEMQSIVRASQIADRVHFHGYVDDHRDVERILAGGSVGVAPYDTEVESFTRWADPAKLKSYLAAGLPIVLTDVPPNAKALQQAGAAVIAPFRPEAFADAIQTVLSDELAWRRRREASLALAKEYDWNNILSDAMQTLGFRP